MRKFLYFFFPSLYLASILYAQKITPLYIKEVIFLAAIYALTNTLLVKQTNAKEIIKAAFLGVKQILKYKKDNKEKERLLIYALIDSQIKIYAPFFIIAFLFSNKIFAIAIIISAFVLFLSKILSLLKISSKIPVSYILWLYFMLIIRHLTEIFAYVLSIKGNLPNINTVFVAFIISIILPLTDLLPLRGLGLKEIIMATILNKYYGNINYFLFAFPLTTLFIYTFNIIAVLIISWYNKQNTDLTP